MRHHTNVQHYSCLIHVVIGQKIMQTQTSPVCGLCIERTMGVKVCCYIILETKADIVYVQ